MVIPRKKKSLDNSKREQAKSILSSKSVSRLTAEIDSEVHKEVKIRAAKEGVMMKTWVERVLREALEKKC